MQHAGMAVLLLGALAGCGSPAGGGITIVETELWVGRSQRPPAEDVAWVAAPLPDAWTLRRRIRGTEGWYRAAVPGGPTDGEPWAIFLPRAYPNAQVFLNGFEVGSGGRMEDPPARNAFRPLRFDIPASAWKPRDNWIQIRFVTTRGTIGVLRPFQLGPAAELRAVYERARLWGMGAAQTSSLLCLVLAMTLGFQARMGRASDAALGWFAAALVAFVGTSFSAFAPDAQIASRVVEWFCGSLLHWSLLLVAIGVRRLTQPEERGHERYWLGGFAVATVAYAVVPPLAAFPFWVLWAVFSGALLVEMLRTLLRRARRAPRGRFAGGAALVAATIALFLTNLGAGSVGLTVPAVSSAAGLLAVVGSAGFVLSRLVASLRESDALNQTLEARVAERERELQANYERLGAFERDHALAGERRRLTREMHDGTGGRLVAALSLLRAGRASPVELEESLQSALDDLRLTIDSLQPGATDLPSLLGLLRRPLERQTRQHGLLLEWATGDAGEGLELSPDQALHLIRMLQEATTNAVCHAGATRLKVTTGCMPEGPEPGLWVEVADDGHGGAAPREGGRGLPSLAQRAGLLGGKLDLDSDESGTRVRISFPIQQSPRSRGQGSEPVRIRSE